MAVRTQSQAEASDLGFCDNHPDTRAVHVTDGAKHNVQRFCKDCLSRVERALTPGLRRG